MIDMYIVLTIGCILELILLFFIIKGIMKGGDRK